MHVLIFQIESLSVDDIIFQEITLQMLTYNLMESFGDDRDKCNGTEVSWLLESTPLLISADFSGKNR